jgi:hypothetical protein
MGVRSKMDARPNAGIKSTSQNNLSASVDTGVIVNYGLAQNLEVFKAEADFASDCSDFWLPESCPPPRC